MATSVFDSGARRVRPADHGVRGRLAGRCAAVGPPGRPRRGPARAAVRGGAGAGFAVLETVAGFAPTYATFFVLLIPTGLLAISFATSANPFMQLGSEPQLRGRVMSMYMVMFIGGTPLGAPFIGWLAETAGAALVADRRRPASPWSSSRSRRPCCGRARPTRSRRGRRTRCTRRRSPSSRPRTRSTTASWSRRHTRSTGGPAPDRLASMTSATTQTRLTPERYLELIAADGERLAVVAEGHLDDQVPPCPGWDVADVVTAHRRGLPPQGRLHPARASARGGASSSTAPADGQDLLEWYRAALRRAARELGRAGRRTAPPTPGTRPSRRGVLAAPDGAGVGRPPGRRRDGAAARSPRPTTTSPSTASTRCSTSSCGTGTPTTSRRRPRPGHHPPRGRSFLVRTGPYAWQVAVDVRRAAEQIVLRREGGPAQATISGEPSELLLWLWGRRPDAAVAIAGDPAAAAALRDLLSIATQ